MIAILFKLNMQALLSGMFLRGAKKTPSKSKRVLFVLLFIYVTAAFMFMFGGFFIQLLGPFYAAGIGWLYFAAVSAMLFALGVLTTIFTASAQIFGAKDNEYILSMPIKPGYVLLSRLLVLLVFEYAASFLLYAPAIFLWMQGGYATASGALPLVIGFFLLPLPSMAVALLLAWLLSVFMGRMRYKNIVTIAFSVGFLILYFFGFSRVQNYVVELVSRGEELAAAFQKAMPLFYAFGQSVANADFVRLIIFVLWAVLPFAAVYLLLSARYLKILMTGRAAFGTKYNRRELRASGVVVTLVKRELAHYISSPTVVMNTTLGSIFALVGAVALLFSKNDVLANAKTILTMADGLTLPLAAALALLLFGSTNSLSAALVSLEGKQLWIVKSMPVSPQTVLLSKALTHMIVSSVPFLLASCIIAAVLAHSPMDVLTIVIIPQILLVMNAFAGVAVNLSFPRLDWLNEIQVVKQSAASVIAMFGSMGLISGLVALYAFVLKDFFSILSFVWFCEVLFTVCAFAAYRYLITAGAKRFEEL